MAKIEFKQWVEVETYYTTLIHKLKNKKLTAREEAELIGELPDTSSFTPLQLSEEQVIQLQDWIATTSSLVMEEANHWLDPDADFGYTDYLLDDDDYLDFNLKLKEATKKVFEVEIEDDETNDTELNSQDTFSVSSSGVEEPVNDKQSDESHNDISDTILPVTEQLTVNTRDTISNQELKTILTSYKSTSVLGFISNLWLFSWFISPIRSQAMIELGLLLNHQEISRHQIVNAISKDQDGLRRLSLFNQDNNSKKNGTGTDEIISTLQDTFNSPSL